MDQCLEIYANVEEASCDHNSCTREIKDSENIYGNLDEIQTLEPKRTGPALSGAGDLKKSSCRAAAVCLGLLCLLLLIGLISLVFLYTKSNSERDQLQTSYNNLTHEQDQLQKRFDDMAKERNDLQRKFQGIIDVKKSSCRAAAVCLGLLCLLLLIGLITLVFLYTKGNSERNQLQTSYINLNKEQDQLQKRFDDMAKERNYLQRKLQDLLATT
ncbi:hypothetical protein D5F01_LYC00838 [Larimichthys crocea]|uniref:Uncharacterized protein n=1 Tax=Larimichthys crocea TaxID=215358 RepID=A0A6G0JAX6_LARCR|nr:hypothetical protein D5F01_LYC00838 [Larimichthys crocea]